MKSLQSYITSLLTQGKFFFSKQEALSQLKLSQKAFYYQAYRLSKKKLLKRLTPDFFMIISPEYYSLGSLPPHWIVGPLMKHLEQDYYIALLSAASLYGATEQQPMTFQVITNKQTKNINLERGGIEFHCYKNFNLAETSIITIPIGYAKISTKEQTMLDLVRFQKVSGYLSNIALVFIDLAAECDPLNLARIIKKETTNSVLQRLGYLLEVTNFLELANIVENELSKRKTEYIPLQTGGFNIEKKRSIRWKLIIEDNLELT